MCVSTLSYRLIFIRHGKKVYDNGKGPEKSKQNDSPLIESFNGEIITKGKFLIEKYGQPNRIITSPYLRTRQTAKLMAPENFEIEVNLLLSEYLGNQFQSTLVEIPSDSIFSEYTLSYDPDVEPETLKYGKLPRKGENFKRCKYRCYKFVKEILSGMPNVHTAEMPDGAIDPLADTSIQNIWIISHGIIIKQILKTLVKLLKIPPLERIKLEPLDIVTFTPESIVFE
jgi:broad specificity phosphatase PhoE